MRVLAIADSAQVIEVNERSSFVALESEWNALVDAIRPEPFHRHEFIRVWLDNFAPQKRWRILAARDSQGRLAAVLPLVSERSSMFGMPVRQLASAAWCVDQIATDEHRIMEHKIMKTEETRIPFLFFFLL